MEIVNFIMAHGLEILGAMNLILMGLIAIFTLIPGEQPEKAFRQISEFLKLVSRK